MGTRTLGMRMAVAMWMGMGMWMVERMVDEARLTRR
jgi:hypothetical protein